MTEGQLGRLSHWLRLRLLVGYLGERSQFAWWPTTFFDSSSHLFLEPVFVRTSLTAQYHGVVEAARRFHDESLNAGSFHLFRLPEEMEEDLHALVHADGRGSWFSLLGGKSVALGALSEMASIVLKDVVGPVSIGNVGDVTKGAKIAEVAAIYANSFKSRSQAFPYFVL